MSQTQQTKKNFDESPNFVVIILFALLGKFFFDFKALGGFNYPLLIKIIYMILIIFCLMLLFHSGEVKSAIRQIKIEEYFKKFK